MSDDSRGPADGDAPSPQPTDELVRLRDLVGPDERAYAELRADAERAEAAARDAEREAGRLRGTIAEMQVQLVRARQDQDSYQRVLDARRSLVEGLSGAKRRARRLLPGRRR